MALLAPHLFPGLAKLQLTVQQELAEGVGPASHLSKELSNNPFPHNPEAEMEAVTDTGVKEGETVIDMELV